MPMIVLDPEDQRRLIARRRALGHDRFDEVWDGVYVMSPIADDQHQEMAFLLAAAFLAAGPPAGTKIRPGVNVSDRDEGWRKNYRCPDVAVFLPGTAAQCKGAYWRGGPDFAVEVRSRGDRSRKKLPFYAKVGTRELLIVDREPWALELYRLDPAAAALRSVGRSTEAQPVPLASAVLPLSFGLEPTAEGGRPTLIVAHHDGRSWRI